jgi:hypothetical protein
MVSLPTRGTNLRLTASSATRRTVQRARPSGGTTAYHCNQTLFLVLVEHFRRPGPLSFIQCSLQTALLVTTANIPYGLGSEWDKVSDLRSAGTFGQLQQSQCP